MSNRNRRPTAIAAPVPEPEPDAWPVTELDAPDEPDHQEAVIEPQPLHPREEDMAAAISEPEAPPEPVFNAKLTADEVNTVRRMNDAVDYLAEEIRIRTESIAQQQKDLVHLRTGHAGAQSALTDFVRQMITSYRLAGGIMYHVDIDGAQLVPAGVQKVSAAR